MPFSEYDTVFFGIGAERTEISGATALPNSYFLYREQFGEHEQLGPADGRLDARQPRQRPGADRRAATRASTSTSRRSATPSTCAPTCRASSTSRSRARSRFGVNAEIGYGKGLGGQPYPIFKNFYGGGLGSVRGFEQGSLGPVDVTGAFIGGNRRFNINNELYLPVPGANADRTLRIFLYADAGNVWGEGEKLTFDSLRASAGAGRQLDLAGRPAQAQLRCADPQAAGR